VIEEGDIVSIDIGVKLEGYYTDSATTVPAGKIDAESKKLLEVTKNALAAGIEAATTDNHVGDIGAAVQEVVEAAGFSVVRDLVGHGIGVGFHEDPQVPNYGKPKRGVRLQPGLTIAIEPMVNIGKPGTRTMPDRWTVVSIDGTRSAHFEHTIAVTENGPRVLTALAGEPVGASR
jgi:methionyl aminopeptidase